MLKNNIVIVGSIVIGIGIGLIIVIGVGFVIDIGSEIKVITL